MTAVTVEPPASHVILRDVMGQEFTRASEDLIEARHQRRTKDTPAHRAAVAQAWERVDAVLDLYLELR
jgi:hypothetical protein